MKRFALILFLLLMTLGAFSALWKQNAEGKFFTSSGGSLPGKLLDFRVDEIRKIVVSWQDNSVTLFLDKDNFWRLKERESALASAPRINGILSSLSTLAPLKRIDDTSAEMLRELNLRERAGKDPADKIPPGILIRLLGKGDVEKERLLLGSGHFPPASGNGEKNTLPKARYVKTSDGKIYLIAKVFEEILPIPMAYVEPFAVRGMERALMMTCYDDAGKLLWSVGRKGSSQAFQTIFPRGKIIVSPSLAALAQVFSKQMTVDLDTGKKPGKTERKIVIRLSDGFTYFLQFYRKNNSRAMQVKLSFREQMVQAYPGESKEMYKRRVANLKLRYAYEKKYFDGKRFLLRPDIKGELAKDPFTKPKMPPFRKKRSTAK